MKNDQFMPECSIPDDIFGYELRQLLWEMKYSGKCDSDCITFLEKLMAIKINEVNVDASKETFRLTDPPFPAIEDWCERIKNPELVARALEVMVSLDKKLSPKFLPKIYANYLKVYLQSAHIDYLLRALNQVKFAPALFKSELPEIFQSAAKIAREISPPYHQQLLLTELISIYGAKKCQQEFTDLLEQQISSFEQQKDFRSARFAIRTLYIIKRINVTDLQIRTAANYEREGDEHVLEKKPNTFYPTISQTFLKGLRLVRSTKGSSALKKRLEEKVGREQQEDFKMLRVAGIKINPEIDLQDIHKGILKLGINSFEQAFELLFDLPITPIQKIADQVKLEKENEGYFAKLFPQTVKISKKGTEVAKQTLSETYASNARYYYRDRASAFIHIIKSILDSYGEMNEAMVERLLVKSKSTFIPPGRLYIYTKGIAAGFNNDFITAAHLLIPQIENSLRHIAEQNNITVTNYSAELQFENLLGGVLEKLKGLASADLIAELKSFLIDGHNVNFRNELAHGLMDSASIHRYGMYLWWLTVKLIMQTKSFFQQN